ncbi:MAG: sucrase ferredoxin [Coleofasciculus sp. S288]|nr:sucrase ferredoxin [Coleofasciculus sp. S288]
MTQFFCSEFSRQAGEDIIGSGTNYQTYILVECPAPWESEAFESKAVPENLRSLVNEVERAKLPIRFLLIENPASKSGDRTKLLIYDKKKEKLTNGYRKKEFSLDNIDQVAAIIRKYLAGEIPDWYSQVDVGNEEATRDILVCTHGSHDKCCARYGNPFYRQAISAVCELQLSHIRIWKASHFGGHRFAPTMIDFPDGRYYGVLDRESFKSILTRTGDIKCLNRVYRGWGILPNPLQVLERELILRHGWDWFNYKVASRIIEQNSDYNVIHLDNLKSDSNVISLDNRLRLDKDVIQAELTFEKPDGSVYSYQAELVKDESKTLHLKGSCGARKESEFVKYSVENLRLELEEMVG